MMTVETGDTNCDVSQHHCFILSRKVDAKGVEPFRNGSVHKFYHLKALITLAQVNTLLKTLMVRL